LSKSRGCHLSSEAIRVRVYLFINQVGDGSTVQIPTATPLLLYGHDELKFVNLFCFVYILVECVGPKWVKEGWKGRKVYLVSNFSQLLNTHQHLTYSLIIIPSIGKLQHRICMKIHTEVHSYTFEVIKLLVGTAVIGGWMDVMIRVRN
jgi:hypothetical protein